MKRHLKLRQAARVARSRLTAVAAAPAATALIAACGGSATPATLQAATAAPVQLSVPPYYVALIGSGPEQELAPPPADVAVVRATATGAVVARITPPRPYTFAAVTGAADDRTFVLYGVGPASGDTLLYGTYRQRLFLLHINPAASTPSARTQLTALPAADIQGGQGRQLLAMALSPDGKSLAAIIFRRTNTATQLQGELTVFSLVNGTQHTWTRNVCDRARCAEESIGDGFPLIQYPSRVQLSWTSDSRSLLFITGQTGSQVRLLDVGAPGTSLTADSRALPTQPGVIGWGDAVLTPNGRTVFIEYSTGAATVAANLMRVSTATGSATVVNQVVSFTKGSQTGAGPDDVLWTNYDGSKIIVLGAQPGPDKGDLDGNTFTPAAAGQTAGVYSGTQYTPVRWPANVVDAAW
jgi:dipeptidyl aminopeptidase/acylaminoacyl peptidase